MDSGTIVQLILNYILKGIEDCGVLRRRGKYFFSAKKGHLYDTFKLMMTLLLMIWDEIEFSIIIYKSADLENFTISYFQT
jgi:hypothetical protein